MHRIAAVSLAADTPSTFGQSANGTLRTTGAANLRSNDAAEAAFEVHGQSSFAGERFHSSLSILNSCAIPLPTSYPMLDQRVADYINHLFQEGESISNVREAGF